MKKSQPAKCPACEGARADSMLPVCLACWGESPEKLRHALETERTRTMRLRAERDLLAWLAAHRREQNRNTGLEIIGKAVGAFAALAFAAAVL